MMRHLVLICLVCLVLFGCDDTTEPKYTIPTPTFTPASGTYFQPQSVYINCTVSNVTIRYTTDGTEPTTSSQIYSSSSPIAVNQATTIKAKAYKSKMKPSLVVTGSYSFNVGTMYFAPLGGTYSTPQTVSILPVSSGTVIHYTTDGTEPTETSAIYTDPILIDGTTTLKAKGYIQGWNPCPTVTANYVYNVTQPTLSVQTGVYYNEFDVSVETPTLGASIRYTTNGSEPTESSNLYTEPLRISTSKTLKVKAFKANWNTSPTATGDYTLKAVAPAFSPGPGVYYTPQNVTITTTTPQAEIHYTTDNSEPTIDSPLYVVPVYVSQNSTLKAKAFRDGWTESNRTSGTYTFRVYAPVFDPPQGNYGTPQLITITSATPGAEIRYTLNGATPTQNSTLYTAPFTIYSNTYLQAVAFKNGLMDSPVTTGNYLITNTVASPTFDPDPSVTYSEPIEVILSCSTPGAVIYYTLDHTPPSIISTMFTIYPIQLSATTEVRAIAMKEGMSPSPIVSVTYNIDTIVATPTFSPDPSILYTTPQSVTIECATANATIKYTTNGTEPTTTSATYEDPILISNSTEIKAKAFRNGWTPSATTSAQYQIETGDQIYAWGLNEDGQCNSPIGAGFIQIDSGTSHTVALRANGALAAWGDNSSQQCNFPAGSNFVAVSAGDKHSMALKSDGTIVAWGLNTDGQCTVPAPVGYTYQAISAGGKFSLALTSNNKIVAWGNNDLGQCTVPTDSNFVKISAGYAHGLALRSTGGVIAWGNNDNGLLNAPSDNVYNDISAGNQHCLAKRINGTVVAWGSNTSGQATAPAGNNFASISAGKRHNLAIKTDGTVFTWGYGGNGLSTIPTGTGYIDASAGGDFSVVLKPNARFKGSNNLKNLKPKFKIK